MRAAAAQYDIRDFGAKPDGISLATQALAAAVARAHGDGDGVTINEVLVPAGGAFLTGSFSLATRVRIRIDTDAVLLASTDPADYPNNTWNWDPSLIDTHGATDTGIVGNGTISGQAPGPIWSLGFDAKRNIFIPRKWIGLGGGCVGECRPKLVRFTDCSRVVVSGDGGAATSGRGVLKLSDSPDWTMLFRRCSEVNLQHLNVRGDSRWPNNDGVDFESCTDGAPSVGLGGQLRCGASKAEPPQARGACVRAPHPDQLSFGFDSRTRTRDFGSHSPRFRVRCWRRCDRPQLWQHQPTTDPVPSTAAAADGTGRWQAARPSIDLVRHQI